ncbi:upstream stimulatory factor 1 isoform X2 [Phyllostomus hastatus]|uniref:upstream stimulatory factor 1 isoform X2 n=2 Tax=Phyllostomus hastatus TaxID=9423 RepID=UPI001E6850AB|nr:upstream stimulatory factor 1 isoform X2 [Phyllostomus hastatus]
MTSTWTPQNNSPVTVTGPNGQVWRFGVGRGLQWPRASGFPFRGSRTEAGWCSFGLWLRSCCRRAPWWREAALRTSRDSSGAPSVQEPLPTPHFCQDEALRPGRRAARRLHGGARPSDAPPHREMKGQQKTAEAEEGTVQIQEGAVATGEDPTSVAIASIQSAATFPDPNVKYVFRTENGGQVMYRVIQVSEGQLDGQTEGTGAISGYPATQSMTQAVIQGAFTSDDAVDAEGTAAETHYTYFPGTAVGDGAAGATSGSTAAVVTTQGSEALLGQATPPSTGQFFVMMSPQEVLQGGSQRSIAPRTHPYSPKSEAPRTTRDEKRRAQHNEVERRRRDKINNWIVQLSKIIPDCSMESTKSGQSKGGILSKACDYIQELRQSNHRLSEELQGLDQLQLDNDVLRQQVEDLKNKNLLLRAQLRHHGVEVVIKNDSN